MFEGLKSLTYLRLVINESEFIVQDSCPASLPLLPLSLPTGSESQEYPPKYKLTTLMPPLPPHRRQQLPHLPPPHRPPHRRQAPRHNPAPPPRDTVSMSIYALHQRTDLFGPDADRFHLKR